MHVNVLIDIVIFHLYVANVSHKGAVHPKKIKHKKYIVVIPDLSKINTFGGEILSMKSMKTKVVWNPLTFIVCTKAVVTFLKISSFVSTEERKSNRF